MIRSYDNWAYMKHRHHFQFVQLKAFPWLEDRRRGKKYFDKQRKAAAALGMFELLFLSSWRWHKVNRISLFAAIGSQYGQFHARSTHKSPLTSLRNSFVIEALVISK